MPTSNVSKQWHISRHKVYTLLIDRSLQQKLEVHVTSFEGIDKVFIEIRFTIAQRDVMEELTLQAMHQRRLRRKALHFDLGVALAEDLGLLIEIHDAQDEHTVEGRLCDSEPTLPLRVAMNPRRITWHDLFVTERVLEEAFVVGPMFAHHFKEEADAIIIWKTQQVEETDLALAKDLTVLGCFTIPSANQRTRVQKGPSLPQ